ncbi:hypothetical protein N7462_001331 [Penicillium macrosclerotiorum]|uniref:uncharacterized protein n=1 Tax=Penicillium macrosclerotiorum TaxID=303699 RepID=UPI00254847A3|nr:uncharacterized protein N7462_001331 [Penicillium macrosclerotiorum]KAJ5691908.1 hypothetical protein N7462_001331 [Penicillium macrosclerotiorum]
MSQKSILRSVHCLSASLSHVAYISKFVVCQGPNTVNMRESFFLAAALDALGAEADDSSSTIIGSFSPP